LGHFHEKDLVRILRISLEKDGNEMFFFDTYALIEIIYDNAAYKPYLTTPMITTRMHLMELYYYVLLKQGVDAARRQYQRLLRHVVDIDDGTIALACEYRLQRKKDDLSYIDCLGYVIARQLQISLLTGDRQFKDVPGVEFVR
jgi:uncharacterized protein